MIWSNAKFVYFLSDRCHYCFIKEDSVKNIFEVNFEVISSAQCEDHLKQCDTDFRYTVEFSGCILSSSVHPAVKDGPSREHCYISKLNYFHLLCSECSGNIWIQSSTDHHLLGSSVSWLSSDLHFCLYFIFIYQ